MSRSSSGILLTLLVTSAVVALSGVPAMAHGGDMEALVEVASTEDGFEYGLGFSWADGDPVAGAHIVLRASLDNLVQVAEPVEVSPGLYVGRLSLTTPGRWQIAVAVHHPDANGSVSFVQDVPGDVPSWSVMVDTADPERVGSIPDPATSILDPPAATSTVPVATTAATGRVEPTTTTTVQPGATSSPLSSEVVFDIETSQSRPAADIGLRLSHLAGVGLWTVPVLASLFGKRSRASVVLGITGVVLTLVTGTILVLWGTPVGFPGLFDWAGIIDLSYGTSYVVAFSLKMAAVLLAALATVRWATRVDRKAAWLTLGGATAALVAVTAMSQFHLLTHF